MTSKCSNCSAKRIIDCDRCEQSFCVKCSGLSADGCKIMNNSANVIYLCNNCATTGKEAILSSKLIEDTCKKYFEELTLVINNIQESVANLKDNIVKPEELQEVMSRIDSLCEAVQNSVQNSQNSNDVHVDEEQGHSNWKIKKNGRNADKVKVTAQTFDKDNLLSELEERERRKNNLIIFKGRESSLIKVEEKKEHDRKLVIEICQESFGIDISTSLRNVVRLGKNDKERPIKLIFKNSQLPLDLMDAYYVNKWIMTDKLKNRVFMAADQTIVQRNESKTKYEQRKKRLGQVSVNQKPMDLPPKK